MLLFNYLEFTVALFLARFVFATESSGSTQVSDSRKPTNSDLPQKRVDNGICKFRVINHITDKLPQQCLKNAWNATRVKAASGIGGKEDELGNITATVLEITSSAIKEVIQELPLSTATEASQSQESVPGLSEDQSTFLSFEEWKKQTLEKAGHKENNNGQRKIPDIKRQESDVHQKKIDTIVDERVIDLQLSSVEPGIKSIKTETTLVDGNAAKISHKKQEKESYRSKDAGKTCKERFSYASFDAGATVLKTHPGAKNAKNVLIENKDSYMLSECSVVNKFIIIELSEDIWIDTVVLANYEFFSSMIRTFRVSVSDRYPIKMDKWKEVGTYEARNSREIQAFLVENPQIWARYIRLEFLDHYGTEYYCPLSLVRVHGTRMLESWKETEAASEGEDEDIDESLNTEVANELAGETISEVKENKHDIGVNDGEAIQESSAKDSAKSDSDYVIVDKTSWKDPGFYIFNAGHTPPLDGVCSLNELNSQPIVVDVIETITINSTNESMFTGNKTLLPEIGIESLPLIKDPLSKNNLGILNQPSSSSLTEPNLSAPSSSEISRNSHISQEKPSHPASSNSHNTLNASTIPKDKTPTQTTSSSSPLPTIQESFFKAVSRRLTLLESNSTLSLAYISEVTLHLHQAFSALSRNITRAQLTKTTVFLDAINSTVLSELRRYRQQYDEIWQSTVISLENQKDESRRQTLAVSERLNILAQEVVWQRRMSMVQSVLLLLCLGMVIFSRVSTSSDQFFLRPRSRVSTNSRQFNDGFLSDPETPVPWLDTPNRTPILL
ncbi:putative sad1 unc domain protein [Erysiphe neolycopersici]|uniref:Putative sad1 unc domain protein n=1 Tax=Erysiphe neolycopersici TaxID=212602 RepID=A0A420HS17_9PEZI|nr:putative sad1 unc domain protein [Erysiphe neolycopersici]